MTVADGSVSPLVYTVAEAAEVLTISESHARNLIADGQLPSLRLGRRVVVPKVALQRWTNSGLVAPQSAPHPAGSDGAGRSDITPADGA